MTQKAQNSLQLYLSVHLSISIISLSLPFLLPAVLHLFHPFFVFILLEAAVYFPIVLQAPSLRSEHQQCGPVSELRRSLFYLSVCSWHSLPFLSHCFFFFSVLMFSLFVRITTSVNGLGSTLTSTFKLPCYTVSESVPTWEYMRLRFEHTNFERM